MLGVDEAAWSSVCIFAFGEFTGHSSLYRHL